MTVRVLQTSGGQGTSARPTSAAAKETAAAAQPLVVRGHVDVPKEGCGTGRGGVDGQG